MKLIFTAKEYKETYSTRLNAFLSDYIDNDENDFLSNERIDYAWVLEGLKGAISVLLTDKNQSNVDLKKYLENDYVFGLDMLIDNGINELSVNDYDNMTLSFKKIIDYIESKQLERLNINFRESEVINNLQSVDWIGTELELTELIEALIFSGKIKSIGNKKEIYNRFKSFFSVKDFNHSDKIRDINKRIKDKTIFLTLLEQNLNNKLNNIDK